MNSSKDKFVDNDMGEIGVVSPLTFYYKKKFVMENGVLESLQLCYETYGTLNNNGTNYFGYIFAMGVLLSTGAAGVIARRKWGYNTLGVYLAMHAALFINFQEINPKLIGLLLQVVMLFLLYYLIPPISVKSEKPHNKSLKQENLQLAVFTAFNILANYKFPLNEALCS